MSRWRSLFLAFDFLAFSILPHVYQVISEGMANDMDDAASFRFARAMVSMLEDRACLR